MSAAGDARYEELRSAWEARHPGRTEARPPLLEPADVGAFDDAPCTAPGAWFYLSPPGDDNAILEAERTGGRVQQKVDYNHTLAAIRAYCDYCPLACKVACEVLRQELDSSGPIPAAGVYAGTLYLDNGRPLTREELEARARKEEANVGAAARKRRYRERLAARGDEGTAA